LMFVLCFVSYSQNLGGNLLSDCPKLSATVAFSAKLKKVSVRQVGVTNLKYGAVFGGCVQLNVAPNVLKGTPLLQ
jgi:hypothetical protein